MAHDDEHPSSAPAANRRIHERFPTRISVDYSSGENFLFSYIQNISEMGIFIRSDEPLPIGSRLEVRFATAGEDAPLSLEGEVVWVNPVRIGENPNPGMGVRFVQFTAEQREQVVALVRTIAYLQSDNPN